MVGKQGKLLVIAPSAYPLGGVADWLDYLLPGLEQRGWRCILGLVQGRHHDVDAYLARHPWHDVVRIANPTGSARGRVNALIGVMRQVQPDLVAVANIATAYDALRRLRAQGEPAPRVVMTLHGLQSDLLGDVRTEADVLDAVVATNQLAVRMAADSLGNDGRVLYASYGVPVQTQQSQPMAPGAVKVLKLLYCGRIEEAQKRVFDLPELARKLVARGVSIEIAIAGGGPDEAVLRRKIDELGVARQFRFLGVLNPQQLALAYRSHDALIITSVWETGPIVAWEAMSHGLPVITSRYVGSGLEGALVHQANCLLFPVGDMDAAASAVQSLRAPGVAERLIHGGLELVRTRYSRAASVALWDAALRRILEMPALAAPARRPAPAPNGRLDRWLGAAGGERIRRALGVVYPHVDPGGEWPHTGHGHKPQDVFLAQAAGLDQVPL